MQWFDDPLLIEQCTQLRKTLGARCPGGLISPSGYKPAPESLRKPEAPGAGLRPSRTILLLWVHSVARTRCWAVLCAVLTAPGMKA
jgi:hypothetical protein